VVCSPVITTLINTEPVTWTVLRPGASPAYAGVSADLPSGPLPGGKVALIMLRARSLRLPGLRDLCPQQRVQNEQGWSVFGRLFEGNQPMAPATVHVGATTVKGGVSGPYPWRRPV
jgi:hypothetical protein